MFHLLGRHSFTVGSRCHQLPGDSLTEPQPTSFFRPSFPSSGFLCSFTSHITSSDTLLYPVNGGVPGALTRGTVAPVPVHGVRVLEAGILAGITVVVLHHLLLLTQRTVLRRPSLEDKAEVRAFGQGWPQAAPVRTSTTGPHNPVRNLNRRLGIGKGLGRQGHPGGLVNPSHNHLDGDRPQGSMMIEVRVPRTWVR